MAPDLRRTELQLEHIPQDVVVQDLNDDGTPELVILVSSPNQVMVYHRPKADDSWSEKYHVDLLDGEVTARHRSLLLRDLGEGNFQLLVSLQNGIQQLALQPGGQAKWFTPRESRDRKNWWIADLDDDGFEDLVEQTRESSESIRWYRGGEQGTFAPAAVLFDRAVRDAEVLRNGTSTDLVLLDGAVHELLRRYRLDLGSPNPFGQRHPLALGSASKTAWCGMWQGSDRVLVTADRSGPHLLSYTLGKTGWQEECVYPGVSGINALAAPVAEPGTLLIWAKNAADLLISRWESGRLTYPKPMPQSSEKESRKILALGTVGSTVWWVQKVEKHLDLYRWTQGEAESVRLRLEGVSAKSDQVLWIGGDRLLLKETHARALKLVTHADGKTKVTSPAHLKKASLEEYKLVAVGEEFQLARLDEGVLQWINNDLQSYEQVMLSHGQKLADYIATNASTGWALQDGSKFIHRIQIEPSGLSTAVERIRVAEGLALVRDPVLGVLLIQHDRMIHLSEGRPQQLKLVDAVDNRIGRAKGVRKIKFHRLATTDIDRDGYDDLIVHDDLNHRLAVLADHEGTLAPKISWPVFDDKVYPYNDDYDELVREPRTVLALDLDGDGQQDFALLSQDRLIFYFAHEHE